MSEGPSEVRGLRLARFGRCACQQPTSDAPRASRRVTFARRRRPWTSPRRPCRAAHSWEWSRYARRPHRCTPPSFHHHWRQASRWKEEGSGSQQRRRRLPRGRVGRRLTAGLCGRALARGSTAAGRPSGGNLRAVCVTGAWPACAAPESSSVRSTWRLSAPRRARGGGGGGSRRMAGRRPCGVLVRASDGPPRLAASPQGPAVTQATRWVHRRTTPSAAARTCPHPPRRLAGHEPYSALAPPDAPDARSRPLPQMAKRRSAASSLPSRKKAASPPRSWTWSREQACTTLARTGRLPARLSPPGPAPKTASPRGACQK